jgi:predicted DNA-binding transcriptional regulator AlpA
MTIHHRAVAWPNVEVLRWMRQKITTAGGDPKTIPDEPPAFWRVPEVCRRTGLSRATLYRFADAGHFPRAVPLSSHPDASVES